MKPSTCSAGPTGHFLKRAFFAGVFLASLGVCVATPAQGFSLVSASSIQDQGGQTFGIPIYLTGGSVECRNTRGYLTLVFTFSDTLVSANATLDSGIGQIFYESVGGNTLTVNLRKVANLQTIQVGLDNVTNTSGELLPPTHINLGMLIGDVDQNGVVDRVDVKVTQDAIGQPIENNYRKDVATDGVIDRQDLRIVRSAEGNSLQ